jgi:SAM-dependent methyltransferase/DNA-directed RNA polymerase subunit RPC12/RpoP
LMNHFHTTYNYCYKCISCQKPLAPLGIYDYYKCPDCKSYVYISDKSAEEENKTFFNQHFGALKTLKVLKHKKKIFAKFLEQDMIARKRAYLQFNQSQSYINNLFKRGIKALEVGFGAGNRLIDMLENGIDAYGFDISEAAVADFMRKYPQYNDRVFCDRRFDGQVDLVYCCALFEHLDTPQVFLEDIFQCIKNKGKLIIDGIPILNQKKATINIKDDINFWKPCHRIIYSRKGLLDLLDNSGFDFVNMGLLDNFNYRVLSMHLKKGFHKVNELRNPCFAHPELPDTRQFQSICKKALTINSSALYCNAVFEKSRNQ